jgi:type VI secretion system protein ImpK
VIPVPSSKHDRIDAVMTDAFANIVSPVFRHLIDFQHGVARGDHPQLDAEQQQILALLAEAEQKANAVGELAQDYEFAKYALVYWIDEVLINSHWSHAPEWGQHILEWDIFHERLRADRFYEKAREAEARASMNPLETFYLCVALGFRGNKIDDASLRAWGDRAYSRILSGSQQPERFLPDEPRDPDQDDLKPLPGKLLLLSMSVLVSLTAVVTLICFLVSVHLSL